MSKPITLTERKKYKCKKCFKEFWENPDIKRLLNDGTTVTSETVTDLCTKHLIKYVNKRVWLMQNHMAGYLTIQELDDYQNKKISEEKLNQIIRERKNKL